MRRSLASVTLLVSVALAILIVRDARREHWQDVLATAVFRDDRELAQEALANGADPVGHGSIEGGGTPLADARATGAKRVLPLLETAVRKTAK